MKERATAVSFEHWQEVPLFGKFQLTEEQKVYLRSIFTKQLTIVDAPSGTGKTTLAVAAAKMLRMPLLYVFSPVEEGKMGFTPGTQAQKEAKYLRALRGALAEIDEDPDRAIFNPDLDPRESKFGNRDAWVYPSSHVFFRGDNFKDSVLLIDEAQNFTTPDLKKTLTRVHDSTKVIVIGHMGQCDLPRVQMSGLPRVKDLFSSKDYAGLCELTRNFRGVLATDADQL